MSDINHSRLHVYVPSFEFQFALVSLMLSSPTNRSKVSKVEHTDVRQTSGVATDSPQPFQTSFKLQVGAIM